MVAIYNYLANMENLSNEKVNLLRQNARSVVRELGLLNDAYFEIGVTLAERHLLIELSSCVSPTMGEIAERLLLDKSTASRLIARAVKKGYIKSTLEAKDKRKRFLHLTELGRKTLDTFEPIAFNQSKQALLTLSPEEIEQVYQGVYLYAKGLKTSRLQHPPSKVITDSTTNRKALISERLGKIHAQLSQRGFLLTSYKQEDENALYAIFRKVVDSGAEFPYESNSIQEFHRQFFASKSEVYVCSSLSEEIIGGFYIRPNFSGRCSHIANAAYMIKESHRGQGIGTLLINASLEIAKSLGFTAMQFNMVLSQNTIALKLYEKLGFKIAGTIPKAIRNPDGSYQDGYVLFLSLAD
jgi:DNA-binding MarR family transcriptional regulator/L-amino acid N-acyltransferase YncA